MPVPDNTMRRAPRNTIGAPPMENVAVEDRRSPTLKEQRPVPPKIPTTMDVMSPDGKTIETHSRPNARDLINHMGWTEIVRPKDASADDQEDDADDTDEVSDLAAADAGVRADRRDNPALAELDSLRDQIKALGGTVDMRMGTKKLRELLAELEAK